jgi:hypothetical protein
VIIRLLCCIALLLSSPFLAADALLRPKAMSAPTIAEYYIEEEGIMLQLEIGQKEIPSFRNLLPDEIYQQLGYGDEPASERLKQFYSKDFKIMGEEQTPLTAELMAISPSQRIKRDEVTGEPIPVKEGEQELVITAQLFYDFKGQQPKSLILFNNQSHPSVTGFMAYHKRLPVNEFRYLGKPFLLNLNWNDPWYSEFEELSLRRTYSSAMSGFIYVEPFEVRKEIILRPMDLQKHWLDLGLADKETIPAAMHDAIKQKVAEFLKPHMPVKINGQTVTPQLDRVNFLKRSLRASTVVDGEEDLPLLSATMGIIFSYPTSEMAQHVSMEWDLFHDDIKSISTAAVDQAGPFNQTLEPDYPVLEWKNFLKNPKLPTITVLSTPPSLLERSTTYLAWLAWLVIAWLLWLCLKAAQQKRGFVQAKPLLGIAVLGAFVGWVASKPNPNSLQESVVEGLLSNIYRAFDHREEDKIYDVLAHSVAGDLLTDIYLETRQSLELANQGGARAKVDSLSLNGLKASPQGKGYSATAEWTVKGSVGHWGHIHQRSNHYSAKMMIDAIDGSWKLTGLEILEEERL